MKLHLQTREQEAESNSDHGRRQALSILNFWHRNRICVILVPVIVKK